jgi:hypothetical protein
MSRSLLGGSGRREARTNGRPTHCADCLREYRKADGRDRGSHRSRRCRAGFQTKEFWRRVWIMDRSACPDHVGPCALGGRRPWFRCEASRNGRCCGRRAAILYSRGGIFACRPCQRLSYECQAETPRLRKIRRARKIRMSLGAGFSFAEPFPDKPPGMHLRRAGNFLPPDIFTVPAFSSKGTRAGGHQSLYGRSGPR